MTETLERFIMDRKNSGRTLMYFKEVPREVFDELARRKEPAMVAWLKERVEMDRRRLEHIQHNIQLHKKLEDVKSDIEEALDYVGAMDWITGDVLQKAAGLDHVPAMREVADVCINNERLRYYQAILYLEGASTQEEDELWDIRPVIDSALDCVLENLDCEGGVFDADKFKVAVFPDD